MKPRFPDYQLRCGWNALLPRRMPAPALSSQGDADVAIMGVGVTGLAIAKRWSRSRWLGSVTFLAGMGYAIPGAVLALALR